MNECPRCTSNKIATTDNFCKVCGMDLKSAAGTTDFNQRAADSLQQFVQKFQQPEVKEILREIFSEAIQTVSEAPDFSGAMDNFFEIWSKESDEASHPKILYKLLSNELKKMSPEFTEKYFNEILIHKKGLEYHLSFVFPIILSDEARTNFKLFQDRMTRKGSSQSV
ncbi:hypothetical protein [Paenibacillus xylanexedens]|uniref:hypothetical protein n=1 Tax=Paenibacillus xylanexedens TaxID=528191 RepID=UPI00119DB9ED|nr:hypothetical protein [Paenibacillus xylanexedens]